MGHSWHIIISVFQLYITGSFSSSAVTVSSFIGDSALLPCSIPESELQGAEVHWRDDEGKNVFDIIGNEAVEDQAPKYKNRVETFPDEHKKGNFSIKINGLQKSDARKFSCTITGPFQNICNIELHVEDRPVGRGNRVGLHGELTLIVSLLISFYSFLYFLVLISSISKCCK